MMDPEVARFFEERKEAWLKKNVKISMSEVEAKEKQLECERLFSLNEWLPNAAKRAGQISISTHPCTFSHPSARKNKNGYATSIIVDSLAGDDGLLRSGNVKVSADALGNAAALDVYKFLMLVMTDGESLLNHLVEDSEFARNLLHIESMPYEEIKTGFLAMAQRANDNVTSSKIKQVYFPVKDEYHLLSILTPSGIVFDLRKRLDKLRFGEEVDGVNALKEAKGKRKKNEYHSAGYSEIYGLTTIGYGGTKPQNISVLNNQNGGKAHLLSSMPPTLQSRDIRFPTSDFFIQSVFYFNSNDVFFKLHKLYEDENNNMQVRRRRDDCYQAIIDRVIETMWRLRSVAQEQFNPDTSQLDMDQKKWLLEEYTHERETEDDWLDKIIVRVTNFVFKGYEKVLVKKAVTLSDGERSHIQRIVETNREALR